MTEVDKGLPALTIDLEPFACLECLERVANMRSYSTILSGKEISRFIRLPDEFQEVDLEVTVRPINKKDDRFAKLFLNPIKVEKIQIPAKNDIYER